MVMQLVDEGRLELDEPVNRYLNPPLRLADAAVAESVTVRQLLTHTGGFYGDADELPDRGDDAVERTVASYADLPQLHRIGSLFSYSNSGYNVLGRLIECLTGQIWDDALRDRLIVPLGLTHTATLPERAMVHRVAVGHERLAGKKDLTPVTEWMVGRGSGPCGSSLATTVADLLAFAKMHLRDGLAADGTRVLSESSARAMREPLVRMVDPTFGDAWGLGWEVPHATDPVVVGHGGNTDGQESQLFLVPGRDVALCVLTNGDVTGRIREKLSDELLARYADVTVSHRPEPAPPGTTVDTTAFVGTFGRNDIRFTFGPAEDGGLDVVCHTGGEVEKYVKDFHAPVVYSSGSTFLLTIPGYEEQPQALTFVREDGGGGPATHVAMGGRVLPRLTEEATRS
jgi:CubicO group peptidase (beta-lactamase class C family)